MSASNSTLKAFTAKIDAKLEKVKCRMHKAKASDKNSEVAIKPKQANDEGQNVVMEPMRSGEQGQQLIQTTGCDITIKQDKTAKRAARRQARKEKWATRRTEFKRAAKKIGKALFLPTAVVGGIVLAPVILVMDVVFLALNVVVGLVVRILDLIFCGPVLVCFVCK